MTTADPYRGLLAKWEYCEGGICCNQAGEIMDALIEQRDAAEAERDEARQRAARFNVERGEADRVAEAALARVAELEAALTPFATGVEAFDTADGTYGDGPVFERIALKGHWKFTISDVRRARAALGETA